MTSPGKDTIPKDRIDDAPQTVLHPSNGEGPPLAGLDKQVVKPGTT